MGRDSVTDVPPVPVSNEMPLGTEASTDLSNPKRLPLTSKLECERDPHSDRCLPNFQIVDNLDGLQKIESRQKQLDPLTDQILKSREKALKNEELRKEGKIPENAPSDTRPVETRPNATDKQPQVYDAAGLETARQRAKDEGKKLFIEVYGDNCKYCKRQEKTMTDSEVQGLLNNAIVVKINGDQNRALVNQFRVTGYPTTEIYSPGNDRPQRFPGEMSKKQLLDALK